VNTSNYRPVAIATEARKKHMHREQKKQQNKQRIQQKKTNKKTIDINITQMMVDKQWVKS